MASIKMNVIRACVESGIPLELGAYFLTMIELAGGDYHGVAPHPDQFAATIARVSSELCLQRPTVEPLPDVNAERQRMEREVIEKAKAYGRANQELEDHMKKSNEADSDPTDGWQQLRDLESTWEEMLLEAIKPLLNFESQHTDKREG